MISDSLSLRVASAAEMAQILERGGFEVVSLGDAWNSDAVSWQSFLCHRRGGVIAATIAVMKDRSRPPLVTIQSLAKVRRKWTLLRERRLMSDMVAHLLQHGGSRCGV